MKLLGLLIAFALYTFCSPIQVFAGCPGGVCPTSTRIHTRVNVQASRPVYSVAVRPTTSSSATYYVAARHGRRQHRQRSSVSVRYFR